MLPILAQCALSLPWAHVVLFLTVFWAIAGLLGEDPPEFASALALFTCIVLIAGVLQILFGIWVGRRERSRHKRQSASALGRLVPAGLLGALAPHGGARDDPEPRPQTERGQHLERAADAG